MENSGRKITLITGASSGIGAELARIFAQNNHDLALVARTTARLDQLADEIAATGRPRPLVLTCDLARPNAADAVLASLASAGTTVEILVNNAGFGFSGEAAVLDRSAQIASIDVNVRALTDFTLACLPQLLAARGKILNVASTAAFLPGPGLAVYYATKAFVLSFSEAMTQELRGKGVQVTALCPGPTQTEFQTRAHFDPNMLLSKMSMMSARSVAQIGYDALMAGRRVVIAGMGNRVLAFATRFSPRAILLPIIAWMQGMRRDNA